MTIFIYNLYYRFFSELCPSNVNENLIDSNAHLNIAFAASLRTAHGWCNRCSGYELYYTLDKCHSKDNKNNDLYQNRLFECAYLSRWWFGTPNWSADGEEIEHSIIVCVRVCVPITDTQTTQPCTRTFYTTHTNFFDKERTTNFYLYTEKRKTAIETGILKLFISWCSMMVNLVSATESVVLCLHHCCD